MYDQNLLLAIPLIFLGLALVTLTVLLLSTKLKIAVLEKLLKSLCTVRGAAVSAVFLSLAAGIFWSFYADACKPDVNQLLTVNGCGGHRIKLSVNKKIRLKTNNKINQQN